METWHAKVFAGAGIDAAFVQDNHSKSSQGILRGLHYQVRQPQGKLVRVISGKVYDDPMGRQTLGAYCSVPCITFFANFFG